MHNSKGGNVDLLTMQKEGIISPPATLPVLPRHRLLEKGLRSTDITVIAWTFFERHSL